VLSSADTIKTHILVLIARDRSVVSEITVLFYRVVIFTQYR